MRAFVLALSVAGLLVMDAGSMRAAVQYPFTITLDARLESGVTTITSKVTIRVDQAMVDSRRARVADALMHGGYPAFLSTLRPLPAIGSIEAPTGKVSIRYSREDLDGSRLVLVADRPLFFLNRQQAKAKAGYELTVVDLRFDGQGGVTGQMTGAARVRPGPDASVLLDDYQEAPVQLSGKVGRP